jgi:DNA-binding GntR family transcriptional regulator
MMHRISTPAPKLIGLSNSRNRPHLDSVHGVYEHIFASIVDQRLPPGTKLNELTLCEIFNVGRRHIAHALNRLAHDRLVTLHANRGAFVAAPDVAEARTIFEARTMIECEITRIVATRAIRDALNPLRRNIDEESANRQHGRLRESIRLSGEFHILLGVLTRNEILAGIVRQLVARTSLVVSLYENQSTMSCWHDDHGALLKLLESRRIARAVNLMREHLSDVEQSLNFERHAHGPLDLRNIYAPRSG